jgi:WXXGXW repeat (2 copies)
MATQFSKGSAFSRGRAFVVRLALVVAGAGLVGAVGEREASAGEVVVRVAPPAARVEVVPRAPSPRHVWAPGYWGWQEHRGHVWYGGHYVVGQPGYAWEPAHWSARGGYWHFSEGHWRRR